VLSVFGRDQAVERWFSGEHGPASPMAKSAPASCTSCGFLMPIGGLVGQAFGVCANPFGADGSVVALDYGCGAHSSVREIEGTGIPVTEIVVDDYGFVEVHARLLVADPTADEVVTSQVLIEGQTDLEALDDSASEPDDELADPESLVDAHDDEDEPVALYAEHALDEVVDLVVDADDVAPDPELDDVLDIDPDDL
jgi:hypothetical protein